MFDSSYNHVLKNDYEFSISFPLLYTFLFEFHFEIASHQVQSSELHENKNSLFSDFFPLCNPPFHCSITSSVFCLFFSFRVWSLYSTSVYNGFLFVAFTDWITNAPERDFLLFLASDVIWMYGEKKQIK